MEINRISDKVRIVFFDAVTYVWVRNHQVRLSMALVITPDRLDGLHQ